MLGKDSIDAHPSVFCKGKKRERECAYQALLKTRGQLAHITRPQIHEAWLCDKTDTYAHTERETRNDNVQQHTHTDRQVVRAPVSPAIPTVQEEDQRQWPRRRSGEWTDGKHGDDDEQGSEKKGDMACAIERGLFDVVIVVDGVPARSSVRNGSGYVYLRSGSEYSVRLVNHSGRRCDVDLFVNGEKMGGYTLFADQRTWDIQRPGNDVRRFTFFAERSRPAEEAGVVPGAESNGLVQVIFKPAMEKEPTYRYGLYGAPAGVGTRRAAQQEVASFAPRGATAGVTLLGRESGQRFGDVVPLTGLEIDQNISARFDLRLVAERVTEPFYELPYGARASQLPRRTSVPPRPVGDGWCPFTSLVGPPGEPEPGEQAAGAPGYIPPSDQGYLRREWASVQPGDEFMLW